MTLADDQNKGLYDRIVLEEINTGQRQEDARQMYFSVNVRWVVLGHYEKIKSLYTNKEYVYIGDVNHYISDKKADGVINLDTDSMALNIPIGSKWICTGVQVKPKKVAYGMSDDQRSPIVLILENSTLGKHYCYLEDKSGGNYIPSYSRVSSLLCGRFQPTADYEREVAEKAKKSKELTKKYGAANAKLILDGKIKIGMSKAMCKASWGEPSNINTSTGSWGTHEQWVYGNSYVYFENGRITSIQN